MRTFNLLAAIFLACSPLLSLAQSTSSATGLVGKPLVGLWVGDFSTCAGCNAPVQGYNYTIFPMFDEKNQVTLFTTNITDIIVDTVSTSSGFASTSCSLTGIPDPNVVAVGTATADQGQLTVDQVWRVNQQGQFVSLSKEDVSCDLAISFERPR